MGSTYTDYDLFLQPDGSIRGRASTNDDRDEGHPTEFAEWQVRYDNYAHMIQRTGGTHFGFSGQQVTVRLDGREVPQKKEVTSC